MPKIHPANKIIKTLLLLLAAAAAVLFLGPVIAEALVVLFFACLLCFLLSPLAALLEKKMQRGVSVILAVALALGLLLAALGLLAPLLARQFSDLLQLLPGALERIRAFTGNLLSRLRTSFPTLSLPGPSDLQGLLPSLDLSGIGGMAKNALSTLSSFAGGLYRFGLSVILSCFFMIEREKLLLRLELLLPMRWRREGVRLGRTLLRELRLYLRGQATIALCVGLLASLGLTIIGVDGGALLGLFVGVCNVIPYLGPFIGGLPAVLVALGSGWQRAAFTVILLFLVQQADGMLLSPRIMGNITGFSPAVVLFALYLAGSAGGIWGLLLSMPLLMTARTLYRILVQSRLPESPLPVQGAE